MPPLTPHHPSHGNGDPLSDDQPTPELDSNGLALACILSAEALRPFLPADNDDAAAALDGHILMLEAAWSAQRTATRQQWILLMRDGHQATRWIEQSDDAARDAVECHIGRLQLASDLT